MVQSIKPASRPYKAEKVLRLSSKIKLFGIQGSPK